MTDRDIIEAWRKQSGPVNLQQYLDPDIPYQRIIGIEFRINSKGKNYIHEVTLIDSAGCLMHADPSRIYTGTLRKKPTDRYA